MSIIGLLPLQIWPPFAALSDLPTTSTSLSRARDSFSMAKRWQGRQACVGRPSVAMLAWLLLCCTLSFAQATDTDSDFDVTCGLSHCVSVKLSETVQTFETNLQIDFGRFYFPSVFHAWAQFAYQMLCAICMIAMPMIHNWGYTFFLNCAVVLCRVLSSPEPCTSQAQVNMTNAHFDPQCLMPTGSKTRYPPVQPAQSRFASWCRFFAMCFRRHRTCCRHTPPAARRAGKSRVKGPRRHWKFWWRRRFQKNQNENQTLSLRMLRKVWEEFHNFALHVYFCILGVVSCVRFAAAFWFWFWFTPHAAFNLFSNAWKSGSAVHAQSDRWPVRPAPSQGLNTMFRGGGRGAARITAHKKEENGEAALLHALANLLCDYKPEASDKRPQHPASKTKPSRQQAPADAAQEGQPSPGNKPDTSEQKLLQSLERIIARAQREPGSLLRRLTGLVHTASQQHSKQNKSQNWQEQKKRQNQRSATQEPQKKKVKSSMTRIPNPKERVQLPKATSLFHSNALMTPHGLMWSRTNPTKPWTKERGKVSAKNIKIAPQPNPRASLNTAPKAKKKASGLCWKAHGPRALWCPLSKSKKKLKPGSHQMDWLACARPCFKSRIYSVLPRYTNLQKRVLL